MNKTHYKNFDALRGILALLVVIYHIPAISQSVDLPYFDALPIFHKGVQAVHIFFCLSGFLIISLLFKEKSTSKTVNVKKFYIRRALRLYPVYYVILIFGFTFYHVVLPKLGIPFDINYNLPEAIAWCISFMPNVFKALYEPGSILIILWSIGIEEQFYIVIAPTLKFIPQNKILLTLSIFTIAYLLAFSHIKSLQTFQLCFFYISAGGVMGIINMKFNKHLEFFFSKSKYLISILIILALTTSILDFNNLFIHHLMLCIIYCLFLALITSKAFPTIKNPSLSFLGKISYGIYMYHMIVVNLVLFIFMKLEPNLSNSITIVFINLFSIAITIIVAALSYKYYERFFLNFKTKFR